MTSKNNVFIAVLLLIGMVASVLAFNSLTTMTETMKVFFTMVIFIFGMFMFVFLIQKR